tara:strand:+ start:669 stop:1088 length:420 start_codon:yes stop_codon:yes gene_type:complete
VKPLQDIINPSELPENQRKVRFWPKKALKLSWFGLGTKTCLSKKTNRDVERILGRVILVTPPKTSLAPDTGPAKRGNEKMKILDVLGKLEKHEAECNLRYQRIEEKMLENKSALKAFDLKLWGLAVLILIAPFVGKLIG